MFYFSELMYRLFYLFIAFILFFLIALVYKEELLLLLILTITKMQFFTKNIIFETSFIYTSPDQLFKIQCFTCLLFIMLPFYLIILLQVYKFFVSSFQNSFLKKFYLLGIFFYLIYFSLNLLTLFVILPNLWFYFEKFNNILFIHSIINVDYEPNLFFFINFILIFLLLFNYFLHFVSLYIIFLLKIKFIYYLKNTKLFLFLFYFLFFLFLILFFEIHFNTIFIVFYFLIFNILIKKFFLFLSFFNFTIQYYKHAI